MSTTTLDHESWCQPTGDRSEVRIETYRAEKTNEDGVVIARPRVVRCVECAAQVVG